MPGILRGGAALTGAAAIMIAITAPAAAEPATGKVDLGANVIGYQVNVGDDWLATLPTNLLGFTLSDGTKLGMYCVEIKTDIDDTQELVERPWDAYPNASTAFHTNRAKINWVLHRGFPASSLDAISAALPTPPNGGIDELEAIAATQAAVWHFSDGVDLNRADPLPGDGSDAEDAADVLALYDHLTGPANTGQGETPIPTLEIDPAALSGESGTRIGPFTVNTTATVAELTKNLPGGVRITDEAGNELAANAIKNGTKVFVDVPAGTADGDGEFALTASANIETGRLFVGQNYDRSPTQSVIVAKTEKTTLTAEAAAAWAAGAAPPPPTTTATTSTTVPPSTTVAPNTTSAAPEPQGGLASTGASVFVPIVIGIVLLGGGIGALLFLRRRRA
jgi:TQXA domain-containing protein/LPXTG-motif cell wall-anchored protein